MFTCSVCELSIGPSIKPVRVTIGQRPLNYTNHVNTEDEYGNISTRRVDSFGWEMTGEANVCQTDGEKYYDVEPLEPKILLTNKPRIPFAEKPAESLQVKLVAILIESALRTVKHLENHRSKRLQRDIEVAVPGIKEFVDNNSKFIF